MTKRIEKLTDLQPDQGNANLGTERGQYMLDESIAQVGAARSIVTDRDGVVIAGNKTLQAAVDAGLGVKVVQTNGNELVVVQRTDLDLDGEGEEAERARLAAYFDNRASEVGLAWDAEQIAADLAAGMDFGPMFGDDELAEILSALAPEPEPDPGAQIDKAAELQEKWQTALGQVWELPSKTANGVHRIVCGDCTEASVFEMAMRGEKAEMALADPPYNVGIEYAGTTDDEKTAGDYAGFNAAWFLELQNITSRQVVTPGGINHILWASWFPSTHCGAWIKTNALTRGRVSNSWCWEPLFFHGEGWPRRRANDVFDYPIGMQAEIAGHPCPKPRKLWLDLIENYTDAGQLVADPFLGSGTTIVACEQLGRIGRGIELSPAYVAVSLERLVGMGLEPRLIVSIDEIDESVNG